VKLASVKAVLPRVIYLSFLPYQALRAQSYFKKVSKIGGVGNEYSLLNEACR